MYACSGQAAPQPVAIPQQGRDAPQAAAMSRTLPRPACQAGVITVCCGGGGIPVAEDPGAGGRHGVEAVVDKDEGWCWAGGARPELCRRWHCHWPMQRVPEAAAQLE